MPEVIEVTEMEELTVAPFPSEPTAEDFIGQRRNLTIVVDRATSNDGTPSITIAANEEARGDILEVDLKGLNFTPYRKNPVVLWAHNIIGTEQSGGLPIGKTQKLERMDNGAIRANFTFSEGSFAQEVKGAWERGEIRAASIGYLPTEVETVKDERGDIRFRAKKSDLLEWSLVPVPADKDAVREYGELLLRAIGPSIIAEGGGPLRIENANDGPVTIGSCATDMDLITSDTTNDSDPEDRRSPNEIAFEDAVETVLRKWNLIDDEDDGDDPLKGISQLLKQFKEDLVNVEEG